MGGAVGTFTELYVKVMLIFVLMVNTLTSPKRIEQFTWLLVIASGYIAFRAVLDYARGINLIENGRVQGVGRRHVQEPERSGAEHGRVPAARASFLVLRPVSMLKRALAAAVRRSDGRRDRRVAVAQRLRRPRRDGARARRVQLLKRKPGLVVGRRARRRPGAAAAARRRTGSASPASPTRTWTRPARARRARCCCSESFDAFVEHPLTGVGAGQFKNYKPEGRVEAWRESHNVVLQVAAELGILGLVVFGFLVVARVRTRRCRRGGCCAPLRPAAARRAAAAAGRSAGRGGTRDAQPRMPRRSSAALAGWFVCALFASVAYHWTFYYLLALAVAPREYLLARVAGGRVAPARGRRRAPSPPSGRTRERRRQHARSRGVASSSTSGCSRRRDRRRILVDARTPVNFTMVAPVFRAMQADPRVRVLLHRERRAGAHGGDLPRGAAAIRAPVASRTRRAAVMRFDAYVASDFMWAPLLRGTRAHPDLPRRRRQVRLRRARPVDARVGPPLLRQRAPAAQLHRLRRDRRRQPGDPARRHAEGRLPGRRHLSARRTCCESLGLDPRGRPCSTRRPGRRPRR